MANQSSAATANNNADPIINNHDFVRMQFTRATQCEYCGKKIWMKDAVQCGRCQMSCHKKCVKKCQVYTVCGASTASADVDIGGAVSGGVATPTATAAATSLDAQYQQRPTVELLLTESEAVGPTDESVRQSDLTEDGLAVGEQHGQQQKNNTFSDFLAQGIKRVNSVNNLAIPGMAAASATFTRSLPPSPQHTPR